jgi:3-dehydroquinate synthase
MIKTLSATNYSIEIGPLTESSFQDLLTKKYSNSRKVIMVDENTHDNCLEFLLTAFDDLTDAEVILLPAGEENKVMEVCFQVWNALSDYGIGRNDLVINLGGGVVSDMGGFIAAVYKRGVDMVNIPTSLLGMVDASIGGKTGIDLGAFKNQLGVFKDPSAIFIDPSFLHSLPENEVWNGFAEILKHALIADSSLWAKIKNYRNTDELYTTDLIEAGISIKLNAVLNDPFEKGERKLLNFGHTIGHAIEGCMLETDSPVSHGHAVAIGILLESKLSTHRDVLSIEEFKQIEETITALYSPIELDEEQKEIVLELMKNDKKNSEGKIKGILIHSIGHCTFDEIFEEEEIRRLF